METPPDERHRDLGLLSPARLTTKRGAEGLKIPSVQNTGRWLNVGRREDPMAVALPPDIQ